MHSCLQGDFLEIREEYAEDVAGSKAALGPRQASSAMPKTDLAASAEQADLRRGGADEDPDFDELMGRLEELEAAEARAEQGPAEAGDTIESVQDKEDTGGADEGRGQEAEGRDEAGRSAAAGSRGGPGVGSKQKRVRFAEDYGEQGRTETGSRSEGPPVVGRDAPGEAGGTALGQEARRARPVLGQVFERATPGAVEEEGTGRIAEVGSEDDTELDGYVEEGTREAPGRAARPDDSEDGSSGSEGVGEDEEEEEADRHFFEELATAEEEGSSEDEWAEDEERGSGEEEDDDEGGPSLETGRQVSGKTAGVYRSGLQPSGRLWWSRECPV